MKAFSTISHNNLIVIISSEQWQKRPIMKNMHLEQTAIRSDKDIFTSGFEICQTQKWCRAKLCVVS